MWQHLRVPKMIQVRNVPDDLHAELVRRARARGQTLSDHLHELLAREVARPPAEEVFAQVARLSPTNLAASATTLLEETRGSRRSR